MYVRCLRPKCSKKTLLLNWAEKPLTNVQYYVNKGLRVAKFTLGNCFVYILQRGRSLSVKFPNASQVRRQVSTTVAGTTDLKAVETVA